MGDTFHPVSVVVHDTRPGSGIAVLRVAKDGQELILLVADVRDELVKVQILNVPNGHVLLLLLLQDLNEVLGLFELGAECDGGIEEVSVLVDGRAYRNLA